MVIAETGDPGSIDHALRRSRVRLYVASFLVDVVSAAYALAVSSLAETQLDATPAQLGYLGTAFSGAYSLGCFFTADWSDRKGSKGLMGGSLAFLIIFAIPVTILAGELSSVRVFYLTNVVYGVAISLFWPPILRELSLLSPGGILWRSVGAFNVFWALGAALGSLGGPVLLARVGWLSTLVFLMGLAVLALLLVAYRFREGTEAAEQAPEEQAVDPRLGQLFLHLAWISNFCASFAMGAVNFVFLYVASHQGFALETVGLILFAKDLGRFAAFGAFRAFAGWHYSLGWLLGIQVAGGAALVASAFASAPGHFVALFPLVGFLSGLCYYSSIYYGLNLRSGEGRKSAVHEAILAMGFCLGPLVSGGAGSLVPQWCGAVLLAPGAVIFAGIGIELALVWRSERRC